MRLLKKRVALDDETLEKNMHSNCPMITMALNLERCVNKTIKYFHIYIFVHKSQYMYFLLEAF